MTLAQERHDRLVRDLETYARQHPQGYRLRVLLLIGLGYGYIVLLIGGVAVVLALFLAVQYAVLVVVGLVSLFIMRVKPPQGVRLDRARFPQLFEEIDRLCGHLQAPKPDQVVLTDDLNAAVLQAPKLGLFAWYTNYLLIGLPLMKAVSPEQFRATLAHEMGHLAGNHSRFSGWVYRVRRAWAMLAQQQGDRTSALMYPFFKWYEPFFRAYSFVLSRNNEYFADHCSAQYAGKQAAAEDLIQVYVKGAETAEIWSDLYKRASIEENPPNDAITTLIQRLTRKVSAEKVQTWLDMALAQQTNNDDTHPSLSDRLNAYGYRYQDGQPLPVPFVVQETAADYFLGQDLDWAISGLNALWQQENLPLWQRLHAHAQVRSQFRTYLQEQSQSRLLTLEEGLKLALLEEEFAGAKVALSRLETLIQHFPASAIVAYHLGRMRLENGQSEGVTHLITAVEQDPTFLISGFKPLYTELNRQNRSNEAQAYLNQYRQLLPQWQRAQVERAELEPGDRFLPHGLNETDLEPLRLPLTRFAEVREAYLARRVVKYLPERPCFILGIVSQFNRQNPMQSLQNWELAEILGQLLCLSGDVRVIVLNDRPRAIYQTLRQIEGARLR